MKNSGTDIVGTFDDFALDFGMEASADIIDAVLPESFEEEIKQEISEVLAAFKRRAKDEADAMQKNISTDYWFSVYFASQNQRDIFLRALNLLEKMDADGQYVDGITFAQAVGIEVPNEEITIPKSFRKPKGIDDLVMEID